MLKPTFLLMGALLTSADTSAQTFQGEIGDLNLKLGTTPSRSMAQGLVNPTSAGSTFHGGLDLSSQSGWYIGQWAPSVGLNDSSSLEVDSYMGFKQSFGEILGYEVGVIHYNYPTLSPMDTHQLYAGLTLLDTRLGAAFNNDTDHRSGTLFADLGRASPLGMDVSLKYGAHQLDTQAATTGGSNVRGFNDWSVTFSHPWKGIDLNLIYSASSLRGTECEAYSGQNSECDSLVTFKAQRTFK